MSLIERCIDHVYRSYIRIEWRKPDLSELDPGTIIGGSTWSRKGGTRWVVQPELCVIPGIGVTHMDLARFWVRENYNLPLRRRRAEDAQEWAPVPQLARLTRLGDGAYVDIRSAYRSIVERVGWDVEYVRGRYMTCGGADLSELTKLAYSAIVAIAARPYTMMRRWNGAQIETHRVRNLYANSSVYRLVRDVLWGVYSDVTDNVDVLYYNTDGCIVRSKDVSAVEQIMDWWGFESRVKAKGEVMVYGFGSYSIAQTRTKRWTHSLKDPTPQMPQHQRSWLRERMLYAAQRRAA